MLGLLALMLVHDARREARFAGQDLVLLASQDRSRWDWGQIEEGRVLLDQALLHRSAVRRGQYVIQAAIASLQAEERLDWPPVAALYGELADLTGSDVVRLNRAVAIAESEGAAAALAVVDGLDLPGYQYWHSTRTDCCGGSAVPRRPAPPTRRALDLGLAWFVTYCLTVSNPRWGCHGVPFGSPGAYSTSPIWSMWTNGSSADRLIPANALRTGKPSPSRPLGAVVTESTALDLAGAATGGASRVILDQSGTLTAGTVASSHTE